MRITQSLCTLLLSMWFLNLSSQESSKAKKVVFIIVDGIAADMLKSNATPHLDAIALDGGYTEAYVGGMKNGYSQTPTISAVGYNSLLTGVWANKHNVWGNEIKDPNYNYPTIFRIYKDQFPEAKTAIFSTWLDNRTKLVGDELPQTKHLKIDYAFDGFELDTTQFPHDLKREYIKNIDAHVAKEASRYIKTEAPDLSWVYLEYSDDMGHGYGDSPQLSAAIQFEDSLIGSIYEAVKYRENNHNEEWLFLVTTDHGRSASDGKGHGGQSDRERSTWIVTNSTETNAYFKNQIPAIVDLLPTMTDFLDLDVPQDIQAEWDGVSLLSPVDFTDVTAQIKNDQLQVSWKNLGSTDNPIRVLTSTTNTIKTGGTDVYSEAGTTPAGEEHFSLNLKNTEDRPIKILLQSPHTTRNVWLTYPDTN